MKEMDSGQDAADAGWRHAYQPFSPPQAQNLHEVWSRIRDEEPVFYSEAMSAWVVSRYDDARAVLTDPRRFSSEGTKAAIGVPPPAAQAILDEGDPIDRARSLLDSDPPHHTEVRRIINEAFKGREVRKIEPDIRALANEIIDDIEPLGSAHFIADYAAKLPLRVILRYLGIPEADADQIHAWSGCLLAVRWAGNLTDDEWIKAARGYVEYQQYVAALVAARRASPRDDLLSDLVRLSDDADVRMDRAEMFGQIAALISAGHETSISLIAFCVFYLLSDRRQWEALCADPRLAAATVKEGMRYESPAVSTWRVAREDTELSGVTVPAGGKVLVLIASANRDRSFCEHADTFDIARKTDVPNLGFGWGPHLCVGATLARVDVEVALQVLAERLPGLRLAPGARITFRPGITVRMPANDFRVEWGAENTPGGR